MTCLYPENGGWWVIPESNSTDYDRMGEELSSEKMVNLPPVLAATGMLCAAPFEGAWWRVKVVSTVPELLVHYIDYGNSSVCRSGELRTLPSGLEEIPPLVISYYYVLFLMNESEYSY